MKLYRYQFLFFTIFAFTGISIANITLGRVSKQFEQTPPPPAERTPEPIPRILSPKYSTGTVSVSVLAYLYPGIDETEYRAFIDTMNGYFHGQGIDVNFVVNQVINLLPGNDCGWERGAYDLINCVGPGIGGYYGPPWYRVGLNTNYPYGFDTNWGLHCEAHEYAHFLAVQDLYWLQTDSNSAFTSPVFPLLSEIMYDPYHSSPILSTTSRLVASINVTKILQGGVNSMLFVIQRMPISIRFTIPQNSETCRIYSRTRSYSTFRSTFVNSTPIVKTANSTGNFTLNILAGDPADNNFDLYYLDCDSGNYWLDSRTAEEDYFSTGNNTLAHVICAEDGQWCAREGSSNSIIFLPYVQK